jgi:hypothetical protein
LTKPSGGDDEYFDAMYDPQMDSATRARRILEIWDQQDPGGLEAELGHIQQACAIAPGASSGEQERTELLEAIAGQMRQGLRADVCRRLLEHLATSGAQRPIQSEKLSFFPYSRSARRTSACR